MDTTERRIARRLIRTILGAGYHVRVWEGEGWGGPRTSKLSEAMEHLGSTDSDRLYVYDPNGSDLPVKMGGVLLIWGNGLDLISDYTDTPAMCALLDPVMEYANTL